MSEELYFLNQFGCWGAKVLAEILKGKTQETTQPERRLLTNWRLDPHITESRALVLDEYCRDNFRMLAGLTLHQFMVKSSYQLFPSRFDSEKNAANMIDGSSKLPVSFNEGSELVFICRFSELCGRLHGLLDETIDRTISALNQVNESYSKNLKAFGNFSSFNNFKEPRFKFSQYIVDFRTTLAKNVNEASEYRQDYIKDFLATFWDLTSSERADSSYPAVYWRTPKAPNDQRFIHAKNIINRMKCSLKKDLGNHEIYFVVFLDAERCREQFWYPTAVDIYNTCGLISYPGYVSKIQATGQYELMKKFGAPSDVHIPEKSQRSGSFGIDFRNYSLMITDSVPSIDFVQRAEMFLSKEVPLKGCEQISVSSKNLRTDYHSIKNHLHVDSRQLFNRVWGENQQAIFYSNR